MAARDHTGCSWRAGHLPFCSLDPGCLCSFVVLPCLVSGFGMHGGQSPAATARDRAIPVRRFLLDARYRTASMCPTALLHASTRRLSSNCSPVQSPRIWRRHFS
jgi:hypothetical protein